MKKKYLIWAMAIIILLSTVCWYAYVVSSGNFTTEQQPGMNP